MKKIFLNLKRFDIYERDGGVNWLCDISTWGKTIVSQLQEGIVNCPNGDFTVFLPEAHIIGAVGQKNSSLKIGCQGVHFEDVGSHNFGAYTTYRPASAMAAIGCDYTLIGHSEERKNLGSNANELYNASIKCALAAGLDVLYCVGEPRDRKGAYEKFLEEQLLVGLKDVDISRITIAYEPVWSIGITGEMPNPEYIEEVGNYIKRLITGIQVVYGGGVREDNIDMIKGIKGLDGIVLALTSFKGRIGFSTDEFFRTVKCYLKGK